MRNKSRKVYDLIVIIIFIGAVVGFSIGNWHNISGSLEKYIHNSITIKKLTSDLSDSFKSDDLYKKDVFINMSGLYARLTGRRIYNRVVVLNNGMLTTIPVNITKTDAKRSSLLQFQKFITERGGELLYVQFPFKLDMEGTLLPSGVQMTIVEDTEDLLAKIKHDGINVVDTIPELSASAEDIEKYFYRTDHHWKPLGGFAGFQIVSEHLREMYPDKSFPEYYSDLDNWTVHEIPDQFLGAWGKRVGEYFTSTEAIQWITPNFETNLSLYKNNQRLFRKGDYEDAFVWDEFMEPDNNKLHINHYNIILGYSDALSIVRNPNSSTDMKVMLIQDSFARPFMTYLSLYFREIDMLDPRKFTDSSLMEYVDRMRPDLVIMSFHANSISDDYFAFTEEDDIYIEGEGQVLTEKSVVLPSEKNANNYTVLYNNFQNKKIYSFRVGDILVENGKPEAVTVALYDSASGKRYEEIFFDIEFCNLTGQCQWTFETPESGSANLELRLYAGLEGKTKNIGITYDQVQLIRY